MTASQVKQAALYLRISQNEPNVDKVGNQEFKLRELAREQGYAVAEVFVDDGVSAYKGKLTRPGFNAMLMGLRDSRFDVVMAVAPDRLTRGSASEMEILQALCADAHAVIHTSTGGVQDPSEVMTAGMLAIQDIFGGLEVAVRIKKQKDRNESDLRAGIPLRGRRPFGFESDRIHIRESEAVLLREAYEDLLSGASVYSIAKTLHVGTGVARSILKRDRNAGWLTYKGARQTKVPTLPEIVSPEIFEAAIALLADPSRAPKRGPKSHALLSGILRCECGRGMTFVSATGRYKCELGHQSILASVAESEVELAVFTMAAEESEPADRAELLAIQIKLASLSEAQDAATDALIVPGVNRARVTAKLAQIASQRAALETAQTDYFARIASTSVFEAWRNSPHLSPENAVEDWDRLQAAERSWNHELDNEKRRAIIRAKFEVRLVDGRGAERVRVTPL